MMQIFDDVDTEVTLLNLNVHLPKGISNTCYIGVQFCIPIESCANVLNGCLALNLVYFSFS